MLEITYIHNYKSFTLHRETHKVLSFELEIALTFELVIEGTYLQST